jgi:hypothetical protein
MFLMLAGHLRPGYDYLIRRKLPVFWRHLPLGPLADDLARFLAAAEELGFTERTRSATASQVIGRLPIQTGRRLDALADKDFDDLLAASAARHGRGKASHHYSSATHTARQVMFHLGVLSQQPVNATSLLRQSFRQRMRDASQVRRSPVRRCASSSPNRARERYLVLNRPRAEARLIAVATRRRPIFVTYAPAVRNCPATRLAYGRSWSAKRDVEHPSWPWPISRSIARRLFHRPTCRTRPRSCRRFRERRAGSPVLRRGDRPGSGVGRSVAAPLSILPRTSRFCRECVRRQASLDTDAV